jgi:hypothetical protein
MAVSLLATKLYTPQARTHAVSRARLTHTLLGGLQRAGAFALPSALAGFGKTTLLSEFASQLPQAVAWLTLDVGDNDPIRFWTYLIAACQTVAPCVGDSIQVLAAVQGPGDFTDPQRILGASPAPLQSRSCVAARAPACLPGDRSLRKSRCGTCSPICIDSSLNIAK